ncbi:MAG: FadR/GntR family transcriptional regulator [Anaerolineae bacterium]|jgi:GntR family transcriptional repressor for pyruvate dehydrogenase complex
MVPTESINEFGPVEASRLYDKIVEQIEERIERGTLNVGDRLPSERELARQFGVSRTVVREATKILLQKGLMEVRFGSGMYVADNTSSTVKRSLGTMIAMSKEGASHELIEARGFLEHAIVKLAASRRTEEDLAKVRQAISQLEESVGDVEAAAMADLAFHHAIAKAAGNRYLAILLDAINENLHDMRRAYFSLPSRIQESVADHRAILKTILDQHAEPSGEQMRQHVTKMRRMLHDNDS